MNTVGYAMNQLTTWIYRASTPKLHELLDPVHTAPSVLIVSGNPFIPCICLRVYVLTPQVSVGQRQQRSYVFLTSECMPGQEGWGAAVLGDSRRVPGSNRRGQQSNVLFVDHIDRLRLDVWGAAGQRERSLAFSPQLGGTRRSVSCSLAPAAT